LIEPFVLQNFAPAVPGGPLGPKNRENQNTENANPSESQIINKKLPNKQLTLSSDDSVAGTSSALEKSPIPPKTKLTKVMKKKNFPGASFPRVSSGKIRAKSRKLEKSETLPN
jgi:hypothetical protein